MYQIDDIIMHPGAGVCKIVNIKEENFGGQEARQYYILKPVYENASTTIYAPVDAEKPKLRELLSKDAIYDIVHDVYLDEVDWIENDSMRKDTYTKILQNGDHAQIIRVIAMLHIKQAQITAGGKKFHAADEKILVESERRINQEFAHALDIGLDEVAPFIMQEMSLSHA